MLHLLSALTLAAGVATAPEDSTELRREALMDALRKGGYTVLLRHARTDRSFNEQRDPVPVERSAQRNLTDDGVRDAALMGVVFRKHRVTFAEVIASPMFRTVETAEYAVGTPTSTTMVLRLFPSTPAQATLVATAPRPGTNRLLVTHHFVIETHVPGIKPGDIGESEAAVVRHTPDGKVVLVGRITLDDWEALANPGHGTAHATGPAASQAHAALGGLAQLIHGTPAGPGTPDTEVPDTHAGHIAREYIAAFNTGSADRMQAFITDWMVADPSRPMADRLRTYTKLFEEYGPLSLEKVHVTESLEVTLGMMSKRGSFRLTAKSSEAEPMRATSVTFAMMEGSHR